MDTYNIEATQPNSEVINTVPTNPSQEETKPKISIPVFLLVVALLVPLVFSAGYYSRGTQDQSSITKINEPTRYVEPSVMNETAVSNNSTVSDDMVSENYKSSWSSHLIPNEKLSFLYPSDWKIETQELPQPDPKWNVQHIKITSPNNFLLEMRTSLDGLGGGCPEDCQAINIQNQILGTLNFSDQPLYIVLNGSIPDEATNNPGNIKFNVIPEKNCWSNICYGFTGKNTPGTTIISGGFVSQDQPNGAYMKAEEFTNSADVKTAIKILETLSY